MQGTSKIALVTGAGSGIGRATALALLKQGYAVVLAGRHSATLEVTVAQAGADAHRALPVVADISNPDSVRDLFAKVQYSFGRLDVLFNNAGCGAPPVPLEELTLAEWQRVVNVNLTGVFLCTQGALRLMKAQD
jgi:NAD(P)-dependent dehydrogenase (short-subunit alcohol dehydrogenase family)